MAGRRTIILRILALIALGALHLPVSANQAFRSCWPEFTGLNAFISFEKSVRLPLESQNVHGPFPANVDVVVTDEQGDLTLQLDYHAAGDIYGLPYNLFAIMIFKDQTLLYHEDYTRGCTGPGISLFPRQKFDLGKIKTSHSETEQYKVIVWGR